MSSLVNARHVDVRVSDAGRGLATVAGAVLALQQRLAVLVHLDLGDLDLGGVDAHVHGVACVFFSGGKVLWFGRDQDTLRDDTRTTHGTPSISPEHTNGLAQGQPIPTPFQTFGITSAELRGQANGDVSRPSS